MNTLRFLRDKYGKTQQDIADYLHVTQKAVSFYELGQREIPIPVLEKLASYFHVSTDFILGRYGEYLRMARQHVAYSPEYVETLTGIKADTLISWEKNAAKPSQAELETLAKVYHVSVAILTGKDTQVDSRMIRPILSAEENLAADLYHHKPSLLVAKVPVISSIVEILATLSPKKQALAKDMIALLANEDKKA